MLFDPINTQPVCHVAIIHFRFYLRWAVSFMLKMKQYSEKQFDNFFEMWRNYLSSPIRTDVNSQSGRARDPDYIVLFPSILTV